MSPAHQGHGVADDGTSGSPAIDRRRALIGIAAAVIVLVGAGFAIYRDRGRFVHGVEQIQIAALVASFACGLAGVALTFPVWRTVLRGLGVMLPWVSGSRVFFTSQLGKYVPGSIWPLLIQMEAGRARGASRRTMLNANLMTVVIGSAVGLALACALLPFYDAAALGRYWWALVALPIMLALLHPSAMPALVNRAFALLHRPPLNQRLDVGSELRASAWAILSWLALGTQLGVLAMSIGHRGPSTLILCVAAMSLAVPLGVLVVPVPAGAGVRDVVLTLVLTAIMPVGEALAVVVTSRVIVIFCDLSLAGGAVIADRIWQRHRSGPSWTISGAEPGNPGGPAVDPGD